MTQGAVFTLRKLSVGVSFGVDGPEVCVRRGQLIQLPDMMLSSDLGFCQKT